MICQSLEVHDPVGINTPFLGSPFPERDPLVLPPAVVLLLALVLASCHPGRHTASQHLWYRDNLCKFIYTIYYLQFWILLTAVFHIK